MIKDKYKFNKPKKEVALQDEKPNRYFRRLVLKAWTKQREDYFKSMRSNLPSAICYQCNLDQLGKSANRCQCKVA